MTKPLMTKDELFEEFGNTVIPELFTEIWKDPPPESKAPNESVFEDKVLYYWDPIRLLHIPVMRVDNAEVSVEVQYMDVSVMGRMFNRPQVEVGRTTRIVFKGEVKDYPLMTQWQDSGKAVAFKITTLPAYQSFMGRVDKIDITIDFAGGARGQFNEVVMTVDHLLEEAINYD